MMGLIRSARSKYNTNYSELINILRKETLTDTDVTEAYNLITEMEKIDAAPDQAITGSFEKARRTIVFRYNDSLFQQIMDEALVLVDNGQYWAAVSKYLEAVGLHGKIFRDDYSDDIIKEAEIVIAEVKTEFNQIAEGKSEYILDRENSFVSSEKDYYDGLADEYVPLISLISEIAEIRNSAVLHAEYFESKKNELLKEDEYDIPFLTTINRTIMGRKSSEREEGLFICCRQYLEFLYCTQSFNSGG